MGDKTGISWTDATWNPTKGCSRTAPAGSNQSGCGDSTGGGCYAEQQAGRIIRMSKGKPCAYDGLVRLTAKGYRWTGKVVLDPKALTLPLRWREPRRIFVNSMSDLFHESLTNEQIAAVFGIMAAASRHTFQILTKRARRMREWFEWIDDHGFSVCMREATCHIEGALAGRIYDWWRDHQEAVRWPLRSVWLGVSVENQDAADERIPELLKTPAAVRFLSCEPLLGEIDLDIPRCDYDTHADDWGVADDGTPWCMRCDSERSYGHWLRLDGGIDWVIAGCESGRNARPCSVEWLRSLRDQCKEAGVPFFLKQAVQDGDEREHAGARADPRSVPTRRRADRDANRRDRPAHHAR